MHLELIQKKKMALYLLYESASGYGLFLAHGLDEIGQSTDAVRKSITDLNRFGKVVKLVAFNPFESALDALNQCNAVSEGLRWEKWVLGIMEGFSFCFLSEKINLLDFCACF